MGYGEESTAATTAGMSPVQSRSGERAVPGSRGCLRSATRPTSTVTTPGLRVLCSSPSPSGDGHVGKRGRMAGAPHGASGWEGVRCWDAR